MKRSLERFDHITFLFTFLIYQLTRADKEINKSTLVIKGPCYQFSYSRWTFASLRFRKLEFVSNFVNLLCLVSSHRFDFHCFVFCCCLGLSSFNHFKMSSSKSQFNESLTRTSTSSFNDGERGKGLVVVKKPKFVQPFSKQPSVSKPISGPSEAGNLPKDNPKQKRVSRCPEPIYDNNSESDQYEAVDEYKPSPGEDETDEDLEEPLFEEEDGQVYKRQKSKKNTVPKKKKAVFEKKDLRVVRKG